jgi:tetratricopeptide (TPR) repeat protein
MKVLRLGLILIMVTLFQLNASEVKLLTAEQWLEDLEFTVSKLKTNHPDLYYKINETKFDSVVAESRDEIARSKSDTECYFAIKRIIAVIEDGHTGLLENGIFNLLDLRFPFRVDEFTDGVYITIISKEYEMFLGSRVIAVNGKPIGNVLKTIEKVAGNDNKFGRRYWALNGISFARVLYGLKIIDNTDSIELDLITAEGKQTKLKLPSVIDDTNIEYGWSNRPDVGPTRDEFTSPADILGAKLPLHLKNQGDKIKYYWFEHLKNKRAIYFQFNQVMNQADNNENFVQFSRRLWNYIDQNAEDVEKFIIDLRYNNGGNGLLILPFLNQIIKRDFINKKGSLYVIAGKRTHSAASIFMYELAVHTNAVFVGKPDACGADLFSDSRPAGNLPNSGFPLWIASLEFTCRFPVNNAEYFMPDFPAPFSSHDYFGGNDPAMDLILNGDTRSVAEFAADEGADAASLYCQQLKEKYKDFDWWTELDPEILEGSINSEGYALMQKGDMESAFQVFTLNTMLFPDSFNVWDSLGEWCFNMKKFDLSLQYYKKSIELNPDNENGKQMIERIKAEQKSKSINK